MKIEWKKVTWYSKALAMALFVALPFAGFYLGACYGRLAATSEQLPRFVDTVVTGDAIAAYLADELVRPSFGGETFAAYEKLGESRAPGRELYLYTHVAEYAFEGGQLKSGTAVQVPVRVTLDARGNPVGVRAPRDGSLFAEDVQDLFPPAVQEQVLAPTEAYNVRAERLEKAVLDEARQRYGI